MRQRLRAWALVGFGLTGCGSQDTNVSETHLQAPLLSPEEEVQAQRYDALVELRALSQCLNRAALKPDQAAQILKSQLDSHALSLSDYTSQMQRMEGDLEFRKQVEVKLANCEELLELVPTPESDSVELKISEGTYRAELKAKRMTPVLLAITIEKQVVVAAEAKQGRNTITLKGTIVGDVLYVGGSNLRETFRLQARYDSKRHVFIGQYRTFLEGKVWQGKVEIAR